MPTVPHVAGDHRNRHPHAGAAAAPVPLRARRVLPGVLQPPVAGKVRFFHGMTRASWRLTPDNVGRRWTWRERRCTWPGSAGSSAAPRRGARPPHRRRRDRPRPRATVMAPNSACCSASRGWSSSTGEPAGSGSRRYLDPATGGDCSLAAGGDGQAAVRPPLARGEVRSMGDRGKACVNGGHDDKPPCTSVLLIHARRIDGGESPIVGLALRCPRVSCGACQELPRDGQQRDRDDREDDVVELVLDHGRLPNQ